MIHRTFLLVAAALALPACNRSDSAPKSAAPPQSPASDANANAERGSVPATSDTLETSAGKVSFHPLNHATFYVDVAGKIVWLDPTNEKPLAEPKADVILITDIHGDHLVPDAIARLKKADTRVIGPQAVADKLPGTEVLANGASQNLGFIQIEAIPMYNLTRGPAPGKLFHDKGRGNGYVISAGDKRIYVSGDTECVDEMKALKAIDVAFVCMNVPYTMPPSEAAACVRAFHPRVLYPYHYKGSDLTELDTALKGSGVEIRKGSWY